MPWPFRRERPTRSVMPTEATSRAPSAAPAGPTPPEPAPRAPGSAWAHATPIAPQTAAAPLTFRGDHFGRSVIGARSMTVGSIPPLHHRSAPDAPGGLLLDVATAPTIVAERHADRRHGADRAPDAPLPPLTHRHLRPTAPVVSSDLLHSDLHAAYTSFQPGRPEPTDDVGEMSWDAEHGFRQSPSSSSLKMVRRRGAAIPGIEPAEEVVDVEPSVDAVTAAELRYVPAAGPRFERPPSDLVDIVRQATGVDVGDARIDRSDEVTGRAASIGAIAFTEGTTVHLPHELGPHDEGTTRAVLAHELTHVAQQRAAGGQLPGENTAEGLELEHQARAVQRSVDDRIAVVPVFLRTAPSSPDAPAGVQRLTNDENRYDWQQRGAPPSGQGARAAFGFGFMQVDPNSAAGRAQTAGDRAWAEQFEQREAATLQRLRDERYREMVEDAERELAIQNLREERTGDEVLELERRDILALRRRLDQEMPWEFGPPASIAMYPSEPALPPEEPRVRTPPRAATEPDTESDGDASTAGASDAAPDAPTVGRESAARQTAPARPTGPAAPSSLRHPVGGGLRRPGGPGASDEPDVSWQQRGSTTREQIGAVFGGVFGQLLAGSVTDADDEAEQRRAEERPEIMRRRQAREQELRHVELRSRLMAARREETSGPVTLDSTAIAEIRAAVDAEMPLEFALPVYLDKKIDAGIDAEGNFVTLDEDPPAESAPTAPTDATAAPADADDAAAHEAAATPVAALPDGATGSVETTSAPGAPAPQDTTSETATAAPSAGGTSAMAAGGALLAAGALAAGAAALGDPSPDRSDEQAMASRLFESASDLDLEMLARRLYGRFRRDLRRELLIDRERAGTLADAC